MNFPAQFFSWVCGQAVDRSWVFGASTFPLCERCTGIYAGAAIAFMLACCIPGRPNRWTNAIHAILLLQIIPFGLHLWSDTPFLRTLSGGWFGLGLIGFLCHGPGVFLCGRKIRSAGFGFLGSFLLVNLLAPLAASGTSAAGRILTVLATVGLLSIVLLIAVNVFLFCRSVVFWRFRSHQLKSGRTEKPKLSPAAAQ
jgi:uncharacterized membrane protein